MNNETIQLKDLSIGYQTTRVSAAAYAAVS